MRPASQGGARLVTRSPDGPGQPQLGFLHWPPAIFFLLPPSAVWFLQMSAQGNNEGSKRTDCPRKWNRRPPSCAIRYYLLLSFGSALSWEVPWRSYSHPSQAWWVRSIPSRGSWDQPLSDFGRMQCVCTNHLAGEGALVLSRLQLEIPGQDPCCALWEPDLEYLPRNPWTRASGSSLRLSANHWWPL